MKALIDGDVIRYRIGFACQKRIYFVFIKGEESVGHIASFEGKNALNAWLKENDLHIEDYSVEETLQVDAIENCLHSVKVQLTSILEAVKADDYLIYLSGKDNFRDSLVDYYKANRDRSARPEHYGNITEYLLQHWKTEVIDGMEADDALGIHQMANMPESQLMKDTEWSDTIICTIDKDLDNVPGWHYNFANEEMYWVDVLEATQNFYSQLITGDPGDNIPGIFKIAGVRTNKKMIEPLVYMEDEKEMWNHVLSVYMTAFQKWHEDSDLFSVQDIINATTIKLREIGKLLWIKHHELDDWEPPNE